MLRQAQTAARSSAAGSRRAPARRIARAAGYALVAIGVVMLADAAWTGVRGTAVAGRAAVEGLAALAAVPAVTYVLRVARALHAPDLRHER